MLGEIAKPVVLLLCMLSLCAVFHSAFLDPSSNTHQRIDDSVTLLAVAAGISLTGGAIFREATRESLAVVPRLTATLPVQVFIWATSIMLVLFVVSWYLETHCIFYRDIRF